MRILIFHYHLNPGGVSRIIESQVTGLKEQFPNTEIAVITGACENQSFYRKQGVALHVNPIVNYLFDKDFKSDEIAQIEKSIKNFLSGLIRQGDILHVHNLNLGKNPVFTKVMFDYHKNGHLLINHAHDFSEDRPVNQAYLQKILQNHYQLSLADCMYPKSNNYKVGVLNRFDYKRVLAYGITAQNVYLLQNPVWVPAKLALSKDEAKNRLIDKLKLAANKQILTYPVRVIRRKNIGELILLSVLFQESCQFLVTLAPQNPVEIEFYKEWVEFCKQNQLSIKFEVGTQAAFEEILIGSDYCITTSIQEGFGMSYLEPWTFGTPVIGRNISSVTTDIKAAGLDFPLLYDQLLINGKDFKNYAYEQQREIIKQLLLNASNETFIGENLFLKNFPPSISGEQIEKNKHTITNNFSLENYAQRLYKMYQ